jgi:hypothetical protein
MAVTFLKPLKTLKYKTNRDKAKPRSITLTKKEQIRAKEREAFWDARQRVDEELQALLDAKHIPETIEQGIARGRISAQEIIEYIEDRYGEPLGPRERKYVVANIISRDKFAGRAVGSQNYCPEVADFIIERIIDGEPLRHICRDPHMPFAGRFFCWLQENPSLKERYTLAMQLRPEVWAEEIIELSDKPRMIANTIHKSDGSVEIQVIDGAARSRLQIETRKFLMSKILPHTYGNEAHPVAESGTVHVVIEGGLPDTPLPDTLSAEVKASNLEEQRRYNAEQKQYLVPGQSPTSQPLSSQSLAQASGSEEVTGGSGSDVSGGLVGNVGDLA